MNSALPIETLMNLVWVIPVSIFIHELEEWNILGWYRKHFIDLPASTETSVRIHIFTLSAAALALTLLAVVIQRNIAGLITVFMSGFMLTNVIQHVIWTIQFRTYAPGLVTGLLCVVCCMYVNILHVSSGLIAPPFYLLLVAGIPAVVRTIRMKGRIPPEVRKVHEFFIRVEALLFGRT